MCRGQENSNLEWPDHTAGSPIPAFPVYSRFFIKKNFKCCKKESGAQEDDHIPGLRLVPGTATKCGFLTLCRKEFKSET